MILLDFMQGYDPDNGLKIEKRDLNKAFKDVLAKRDIEWIYLMVFIKTKRHPPLAFL